MVSDGRVQANAASERAGGGRAHQILPADAARVARTYRHRRQLGRYQFQLNTAIKLTIMIICGPGRFTIPGFTPYSMSKYAVVSFADGLRREMAKWNVSVHTIEPSLYK